jgi:hypothetical protein
MSALPGRTCETCGAGLDGAQRYCLNCGSRAGARSQQLSELQRRAVAGLDVSANPPAETPEVSTLVSAPASAGPSMRLPTPRISALLVLVFLGFGTVLGSAAGSGRARLAADVSPQLKVIVPSGAVASSPTSASGETTEPPGAESEATPEAGAGGNTSSSPSKTGESASEKESGGPGEAKEKASKKHAGTKPATKLPALKHVFLIVLENEPYAAVFGPESKARFLAGTLEKKGELLLRYEAVAHEQLANGIALISGQGPTPQTAEDCPTYSAVTPAGEGANGQVLGTGCVYPSSTATIGEQLAAQHLSWRAYVEGIDEPGVSAGACAHPAAGGADVSAEAGPYATFRDPFVYFEAVVSSPSCASDVVGLSALKGDLASASSTPTLSYIVPDRCHDAGPTPCSPGATAGPADADGLLESVVPRIMASKAYKDGGLLVITTDEAPSSGEFADSSSCCGQPPSYADLPIVEGKGHGGGSVGALLLSPFVPAAKTSAEPYNHFSLLRTIEDIFKLKHLGYAGLSSVKALSPSLFTAKG